MTKALVPLLAALAMTATFPASAQDADAAPAEEPAAAPQAALPDGMLIEIVRESLVVEPFNITVAELDGMMLFGSDGAEFGEIDAVLGDASGAITALAVRVGGVLGMGDRQILFPIETIQPDGLRLTVDLTASALEQHPYWAE